MKKQINADLDEVVEAISKVIAQCLVHSYRSVPEDNIRTALERFVVKGNEMGRLTKALSKIANPIKAMQDDLKDGEILSLMAFEIANSANYLKGIAADALNNITRHTPGDDGE